MRLTMIPYPTECQKKHQWSSKLHHYDLGVFLFCCSGSQCNVLPRRHVQINPIVNFFIGEVLLQVCCMLGTMLARRGHNPLMLSSHTKNQLLPKAWWKYRAPYIPTLPYLLRFGPEKKTKCMKSKN